MTRIKRNWSFHWVVEITTSTSLLLFIIFTIYRFASILSKLDICIKRRQNEYEGTLLAWLLQFVFTIILLLLIFHITIMALAIVRGSAPSSIMFWAHWAIWIFCFFLFGYRFHIKVTEASLFIVVRHQYIKYSSVFKGCKTVYISLFRCQKRDISTF